MADKHWLTSVASQEMADVKYVARMMMAHLEAAMADGRIDGTERTTLFEDAQILMREVDEAYNASEEASHVLSEFQFRLKAGMGARPHKYLEQRERDLRARGLLADYPPERDPEPAAPAGVVVRFTVKKKTSAVTEAPRVSRQAK